VGKSIGEKEPMTPSPCFRSYRRIMLCTHTLRSQVDDVGTSRVLIRISHNLDIFAVPPFLAAKPLNPQG
jgi:hypothetical protein